MKVEQTTTNSISNQAQAQESNAPKKSRATQHEEAIKLHASDRDPVRGDVKADISPKAKEMAQEMAKVKDLAAQAPDVREEKIAELKRRINQGQYKVDADAIADRLVDEHTMSGLG